MTSRRQQEIQPQNPASQNQPPPSTLQTTSRYPQAAHSTPVSTRQTGSTAQFNTRPDLNTTQALVPVSNSRLNQSHTNLPQNTPTLHNTNHTTSHQQHQSNPQQTPSTRTTAVIKPPTFQTPHKQLPTARATNASIQTPSLHKQSSSYHNTSSNPSTHLSTTVNTSSHPSQTPSLHKQSSSYLNTTNNANSTFNSSTYPSQPTPSPTQFQQWMTQLDAKHTNNKNNSKDRDINRDVIECLETQLYHLESLLHSSSTSAHPHDPQLLLTHKEYDLVSFQLAVVQLYQNLSSHQNTITIDEIRKFTARTVNSTANSSTTLNAAWNDMIKVLVQSYQKSLVPQIIENQRQPSPASQHTTFTSLTTSTQFNSTHMNNGSGANSNPTIDLTSTILSPRSLTRTGLNSTFSIPTPSNMFNSQLFPNPSTTTPSQSSIYNPTTQPTNPLNLDLAIIQDSNNLVFDIDSTSTSNHHDQNRLHTHSFNSHPNQSPQALQEQIEELVRQNQILQQRNQTLDKQLLQSQNQLVALQRTQHSQHSHDIGQLHNKYNETIENLQITISSLQDKLATAHLHLQTQHSESTSNNHQLSNQLTETMTKFDILKTKYSLLKAQVQVYIQKYGIIVKKSGLKNPTVRDRSDTSVPNHLSSLSNFTTAITSRKVSWKDGDVEKMVLTVKRDPSRKSGDRSKREFSYEFDPLKNFRSNLFNCPAILDERKPNLIERGRSSQGMNSTAILTGQAGGVKSGKNGQKTVEVDDAVPSWSLYHSLPQDCHNASEIFTAQSAQKLRAETYREEVESEERDLLTRVSRQFFQISTVLPLPEAMQVEQAQIEARIAREREEMEEKKRNGEDWDDVEKNNQRVTVFTLQDKFVYICKLHYYQRLEELYAYQQNHENQQNVRNPKTAASLLRSGRTALVTSIELNADFLNRGEITVGGLYNTLGVEIDIDYLLGSKIIPELVAFVWNTTDFHSCYHKYFPVYNPFDKDIGRALSAHCEQFRTHLFEWVDIDDVMPRNKFPYVPLSTVIPPNLQHIDPKPQLEALLRCKQVQSKISFNTRTNPYQNQQSHQHPLEDPRSTPQFTPLLSYLASQSPQAYKNYEHSSNSDVENEIERKRYLKSWERNRSLYLDVYSHYYWLYVNLQQFLTNVTQQDIPYDCPTQSCFYPWFAKNATLFFTAPSLFKPVPKHFSIRHDSQLYATVDGCISDHFNNAISTHSSADQNDTSQTHPGDNSTKRPRISQLIIPNEDDEESDSDSLYDGGGGTKPRVSLLGGGMFSPQPPKRRSKRLSDEESSSTPFELEFAPLEDEQMLHAANLGDISFSDAMAAFGSTPQSKTSNLRLNLPPLHLNTSRSTTNNATGTRNDGTSLISPSTSTSTTEQGNDKFGPNSSRTKYPSTNFNPFSQEAVQTIQQLLNPYLQLFPIPSRLPRLSELVLTPHPVTGTPLPSIPQNIQPSPSSDQQYLSSPRTAAMRSNSPTFITIHPSSHHPPQTSLLPLPQITTLCQGLDWKNPTKTNHIFMVLTQNGLLLNRISKTSQHVIPFSSILSLSAEPVPLPTRIESVIATLASELFNLPMIVHELQKYKHNNTKLSSPSTLDQTDDFFKFLQMHLFAALSRNAGSVSGSSETQTVKPNQIETDISSDKSSQYEAQDDTKNPSLVRKASSLFLHRQVEVIGEAENETSKSTHNTNLSNRPGLSKPQYTTSTPLNALTSQYTFTNHVKSAPNPPHNAPHYNYNLVYPVDMIITPLWLQYDDGRHKMCLKFIFQSNSETITWLTSIRTQLAFTFTPLLFTELMKLLTNTNTNTNTNRNTKLDWTNNTFPPKDENIHNTITNSNASFNNQKYSTTSPHFAQSHLSNPSSRAIRPPTPQRSQLLFPNPQQHQQQQQQQHQWELSSHQPSTPRKTTGTNGFGAHLTTNPTTGINSSFTSSSPFAAASPFAAPSYNAQLGRTDSSSRNADNTVTNTPNKHNHTTTTTALIATEQQHDNTDQPDDKKDKSKILKWLSSVAGPTNKKDSGFGY